MGLFDFLKPKSEKPYPYKDILHLWENDYLMIELLPIENLEFVKRETKRVKNFGKEHFDGNGFTDITPIGEKPVKTIEKLIYLNEVEIILKNSGLKRIEKFHMQDVGLLEDEKAPLGFGTNKFAVMCDSEGTLLENIWLTGRTENDDDREKLVNALYLFGQKFDFIAVNWYKTEYYGLDNKESIQEFIKNGC